jgi:hypothetical protein
MLARMAKTDKMDKVKPDHWMQLAKKELEIYEEKYHPRWQKFPSKCQTFDDWLWYSKQNSHESVKERMDRAMHRDREESRPVLRHFSMQRTRRNEPPKVVKFHLLRSIPDPKPILVQRECKLGDAVPHLWLALIEAFAGVPSLPEILWNFCRRSENRVTLADNPHFYHHHLRIKSPNTYDDGFTTDPMDYYQDVEDMCVLTNKPGRLFLECGKKSRAFDNVWRTNGIFIFKGRYLAFYFLLFSRLTSFQMFLESSMVKVTSEHPSKASPANGVA